MSLFGRLRIAAMVVGVASWCYGLRDIAGVAVVVWVALLAWELRRIERGL